MGVDGDTFQELAEGLGQAGNVGWLAVPWLVVKLDKWVTAILAEARAWRLLFKEGARVSIRPVGPGDPPTDPEPLEGETNPAPTVRRYGRDEMPLDPRDELDPDRAGVIRSRTRPPGR